MVQLSIIVPNYNGAQYLDEFYSRMSAENWENAELIIVDDGSTDQSKQLIENLLSLSSNRLPLRVKFSTNQGPSSARNMGIDMARGRFIRFVDVDDTLDAGFVQNWIKIVQDSPKDLILLPIIQLDSEVRTVVNGNVNVNTLNRNSLVKAISDYSIVIYSFSFLIRTSLAKAARFDESLWMSEDQNFVFRLLRQNLNIQIGYNPEVKADYTYVIRKGSLSHSDAITRVKAEVESKDASVSLFLDEKQQVRQVRNLLFGALLEQYELTRAEESLKKMNGLYWQTQMPWQSRLKRGIFLIREIFVQTLKKHLKLS